MFWIGFTQNQPLELGPKERGCTGLIVLGTHEEHFVAHTWEWSQEDYLNQWRDGLSRALDGKHSALITDMKTPIQSSHLVWWPLWRVDHHIVFQNQLLFFAKHQLTGPRIEVELLYRLIGEHTSFNADGVPVSEWQIPVSDVERFLAEKASYPRTSGSYYKF